MRFQVPQFIERETRIAGPLTFKQFSILAIAFMIVVLLWLTFAKTNFFIFLVTSIFSVGLFAGFAFVNIGGRPLLSVMGNFFSFFTTPRIYVWRKKALPPKIIWKKMAENAPKKEEVVLKIAERSRLLQLANRLETGSAETPDQQ